MMNKPMKMKELVKESSVDSIHDIVARSGFYFQSFSTAIHYYGEPPETKLTVCPSWEIYYKGASTAIVMSEIIPQVAELLDVPKETIIVEVVAPWSKTLRSLSEMRLLSTDR